MKALIRNARTKTFLTPSGDWSLDVRSAQNLEDWRELVRLCRINEIEGTQVYFLFEDQPSDANDFVLALGDALGGSYAPWLGSFPWEAAA